MKDAKSLPLELLAAIPNGEKLAPLFAEDGVVELPFLHSVETEASLRRPQGIAGFYDVVKQLYPDLMFKPGDIHVLIETPDQVLAEYIARPTAAATGRRIHHMFAARFVAENDEIKLLRESLNVGAAAQALLPGGVADLPRPSDEADSFKPGYQS
jgi:uncharacterized protein